MVEKLKQRIAEANEAYRQGKPIMSDAEFDILIEELEEMSPDDELLSLIGHRVSDETRKRKLPIPMASMNKIKSIEDIRDWHRLKLPSMVEVICTPKYDGLSLCVDETTDDATTRGDGTFGQASDEHYRLIGNHLSLENTAYRRDTFRYTWGEVIMPKQKFIESYSEDFANPRNLVAGLLNSKSVQPALSDIVYIKYGGIAQRGIFTTKAEILDCLNEGQATKVPYYTSGITDLTEEKLIDLFKEWSKDFEIDGVIIEVNNLAAQDSLGRETSSGNPIWARAFKHPSFEQSAITTIKSIEWNISKQGYAKPVLIIEPVRLDGVTVSRVTGNNAKFVMDMGLGAGAKVVVKRSGMVIPIIADVIEGVEFQMPDLGFELEWDGPELKTIGETDDQRIKMNVAFFEILEADNVSEGIIKQLWDAGFATVKSILDATKDDFEKVEGFGKRKAKIVYDAIQKSVSGVQLSKLQHATGLFKGLGSKKLVLLEGFKEKPTVGQVMEIEGFAEISARAYVDAYDSFFEFIKDLPVTIEEKAETVLVGTDLEGKQFVFTGVRRKDLEEVIESRGGKIGSGVSKATTYLVMKAKGSGSSKEEKAIKLGVEILTVEELEDLLK